MKRNLVNFLIVSLLAGQLLGLSACSMKAELQPHRGLDVWSRLADFTALEARVKLTWKGVDGRSGSSRVRLTLSGDDKLKLQWLLPWGAVAGQLLINQDDFWFSDARRRETWQGKVGQLDEFFSREAAWQLPSAFYHSWSLLFGGPRRDIADQNQAVISYLEEDGGLALLKVVAFNDGSEMHIRMSDLKSLDGGRFFPASLEVLSPAGELVLKFGEFHLDADLTDQAFIYDLSNFTLRPFRPEGRS